MRNTPKVVVRKDVACQSSRNGAAVSLIVVHDTEGANLPESARDLEGLAAYFDRVSTQASSHVATDEDGQSARMVDDDKKAWAQSYYNSVALSIEQIGFAKDNWRSKKKRAQIDETARWIALWSHRHGIPIRRAIVLNGRVVRSGVTQHRNLGYLGGGHVDVKVTFPMTRLLKRAKYFYKETTK